MGVRRGTATPSAVFRGTVPVKKIMRGTVEVWSAYVSPYPLSGTGTISTGAGPQTAGSHTIQESGSFTLKMLKSGSTGDIGIYVNGSLQESSGGSTLTITRTLTPGALVEFKWARSIGSATIDWSIVKN
jgi:hypothetical protein